MLCLIRCTVCLWLQAAMFSLLTSTRRSPGRSPAAAAGDPGSVAPSAHPTSLSQLTGGGWVAGRLPTAVTNWPAVPRCLVRLNP